MTIYDPSGRRRARPKQLIPFAAEKFAGLDLRSDPQEVGWTGALDALNVEFDHPGRIKSRAGYSSFVTAPAAVTAIGTHQRSNHLLFGYQGAGNARVRAVNSNGVTVATYTGLFASTARASFASMGIISGGTETHRTYVSIDRETLQRYDGTAFTLAASPAAANGGPIAVQPSDNRLVMASGSTVNFSNAGDPGTWGANDYVTLDPGDGETIVALEVFNNQLFAFKQSKFYVFYGNSTDSTGATVFNYRTVEGGVGVSYDASSGTAIAYGSAAARDGIYFVHDTGIYRTTGSQAEVVSRDIEPLFRGETSVFSLPTAVAEDGEKVLTVVGDRLYFAYDDGSGMLNTLVYDTVDRWWSYYDLGAAVMTPYRGLASTQLLFAKRASAEIFQHGLVSQTTDNGSVIISRYQSGFSDLGVPGAEKILREVMVDGSGTVMVSVARDDRATADTVSNLVLGTSPAVDNGRHLRANRGRNFSYVLAANVAITIHRVVGHHLAEREPGAATS